jgi:hypothetical protein
MEPSSDVRVPCGQLRDRLMAVLGEKLVGIYLYGGAASPDGLPAGDLDFHVILDSPLTDGERSAIDLLYDELAQTYPPLGGELDGYFVLLDDARRGAPPAHQLCAGLVDNSWALHRAHMLAGRCIVLHGPDPQDLFPEPVPEEIEEALLGELGYLEAHLTEYPAYAVLNLCRLMYSFRAGEVVISKAASAEWAKNAFPQWGRHIDLALRSYAHRVIEQESAFLATHVGEMHRFARRQIGGFRRSFAGDWSAGVGTRYLLPLVLRPGHPGGRTLRKDQRLSPLVT